MYTGTRTKICPQHSIFTHGTDVKGFVDTTAEEWYARRGRQLRRLYLKARYGECATPQDAAAAERLEKALEQPK